MSIFPYRFMLAAAKWSSGTSAEQGGGAATATGRHILRDDRPAASCQFRLAKFDRADSAHRAMGRCPSGRSLASKRVEIRKFFASVLRLLGSYCCSRCADLIRRNSLRTFALAKSWDRNGVLAMGFCCYGSRALRCLARGGGSPRPRPHPDVALAPRESLEVQTKTPGAE